MKRREFQPEDLASDYAAATDKARRWASRAKKAHATVARRMPIDARRRFVTGSRRPDRSSASSRSKEPFGSKAPESGSLFREPIQCLGNIAYDTELRSADSDSATGTSGPDQSRSAGKR